MSRGDGTRIAPEFAAIEAPGPAIHHRPPSPRRGADAMSDDPKKITADFRAAVNMTVGQLMNRGHDPVEQGRGSKAVTSS